MYTVTLEPTQPIEYNSRRTDCSQLVAGYESGAVSFIDVRKGEQQPDIKNVFDVATGPITQVCHFYILFGLFGQVCQLLGVFVSSFKKVELGQSNAKWSISGVILQYRSLSRERERGRQKSEWQREIKRFDARFCPCIKNRNIDPPTAGRTWLLNASTRFHSRVS